MAAPSRGAAGRGGWNGGVGAGARLCRELDAAHLCRAVRAEGVGGTGRGVGGRDAGADRAGRPRCDQPPPPPTPPCCAVLLTFANSISLRVSWSPFIPKYFWKLSVVEYIFSRPTFWCVM